MILVNVAKSLVTTNIWQMNQTFLTVESSACFLPAGASVDGQNETQQTEETPELDGRWITAAAGRRRCASSSAINVNPEWRAALAGFPFALKSKASNKKVTGHNVAWKWKLDLTTSQNVLVLFYRHKAGDASLHPAAVAGLYLLAQTFF